MKKVMLSLALMMGLGITQINAQSVGFGVKGEANTSNFILSDMDNMKSTMGIGASLGGFMKIDLGRYFALQPELLFHFKNSELENKTTGAKTNYQYFGAEIPVYAVGQMHLAKNGRVFIGIGPYLGLGFDAKYKTSGMDDIDLYEKNDITDEAVMQRFDIGAGVMIGYEFDFGLQINAGYKMSLYNALDAGKDNAEMQNQTINLGLAYKF